jgi:hypothetical protein
MKMCTTDVYVTGNGLQGRYMPAVDVLNADLAAKYSPVLLALGAALLIYLIMEKE